MIRRRAQLAPIASTTSFPGGDGHVGVRWENDGSYTPTCALCLYEGVARPVHAAALAAARAHAQTKKHKRALARLASYGSGATRATR